MVTGLAWTTKDGVMLGAISLADYLRRVLVKIMSLPS